MQMLRHSPFVRAFVLPVTLASFMAGCSLNKWSRIDPPSRQAYAEHITEQQPDKIRITLAPERTRWEFHAPRVTEDGVSGFVEGDSVWVDLERVLIVEVRKPSAWKIGLLAYVGVGLVAIGILAATGQEGELWGWDN
jgi:hypothetical protein